MDDMGEDSGRTIDKENESEGSGDSELETFDHQFNVIVLGDSGVGKTDLIGNMCDQKYETKFVMTTGIDVKSHMMEMDGKKCKIQLWDPSGSDKYRHLLQKYIASAHGIIYVYDATYPRSFRNILKWMDLVHKSGGGTTPRLLIGNKCDIPKTAIPVEEGRDLCMKADMPFLETSALSQMNVDKIFPTIVRMILDAQAKEKRI